MTTKAAIPRTSMASAEPHSAENNSLSGLTAIICDSCEDNGERPLLAALKETIRRLPHAVLVRTPCPFSQMWCHTRKISASRGAGQVVLVQRCTDTRRPLGPVIVVGPVETADDVALLTRWLETKPLAVASLPQRLRRLQNTEHTNPN
ncbi:hypothetical protein OU415_35845 [Saccharopolyspora sp. WRP15-2]|uniref:Uncharacterized protein n=1 Tax=Saccharopolyspora oryzae TaxID=2997343 RepID=A0ABT4VA47_9PSEU|nr:hypothetical protein [Saccharopolyspora oryzae]MDA3630845.1 hypothetical protein [Saccharopolyspora oryzae]